MNGFSSASTLNFNFSWATKRYGETLHVIAKPNAGMNEAINAWMAQASRYNYNPGFSPSTGTYKYV